METSNINIVECPKNPHVQKIKILRKALELASEDLALVHACPMAYDDTEPWPEGCKEHCEDIYQDKNECWAKYYTNKAGEEQMPTGIKGRT